MKRRLPLGTLLLLKAFLVEGCGYQEEQPAPQTAEVETPPLAAAAAIDRVRTICLMSVSPRKRNESSEQPWRSPRITHNSTICSAQP